MLSPGPKSLGDIAIGAAGTQVTTPVTGLAGMTAVSILARLIYGSGGTTVRAYVQTSLDQGTTWIDVACILFGTTSEAEVVNLSGLTPRTTPAAPTDGSLADDTSFDGILGDQLRVKTISTGTYAGSTVLSVRAVAR